MARMRTIQPPHPSEKFTLAEAMRAWQIVEAEDVHRATARVTARRARAVNGSAHPVRLKGDEEAKVAADRGR